MLPDINSIDINALFSFCNKNLGILGNYVNEAD